MIEHLTETPSKIAFLGPGCSIAADPVAETLPFWNLTEISFSLTSPILSNKEKYPNIYRINPAEIIHDPALLALTNHFNWERLFIIKHELGLFNLITEALQAMLTRNKKRVNVVGFLRNATSPIKLLKDQGARILIVYMYESQARDLFCAAFKNEFYGPEIVWILRGWYQKQWWTIPDTECSVEDMRKVMTNVIYAEHVNYGTNKNVTVLGLTQAEFQDKYNELIRKKNSTIYDANKYAPYSYDGIFMLAHALNATEEELKRMNQSLRDFTYARLDITEIIKEKISKTDDIEGLTGDIKLDKRGDRIVNVWLQQLQGGDHDVVNIALYNTENNSINFLPSRSFIWAGGDVPLDKRAETKILLCISRRIFWWTVGISICGLFIAFYFLWLNAKNGEERYFKMSTPPLNNLMIIGAIISYIYVPICGVKSCTMNATFTNSILCKIDAFLISIAFSLIFGAIFMKTWRIYKIFTNVKLSKQLRFLTNKHLIILVLLLVAFDIAYLTLWSVIHPLEDSVKKVLTEKNQAVNKVYFAHKCTSEHYQGWFAGLASCKALLMLFGMFLTWETRNVSFPGLNDSKYIGICVYNIFIITTVVMPVVMFALPIDVNAKYCVIVFSVLFCTTTTLVLMFFSKINPGRKSTITPTNPTMTVDQTMDVVEARPQKNAIGQCPTCKHPKP
ncbi:gamma-aminobutyric acid type B receptor subunit 2-like [Dendronephthya gigantea]|uniref:gamma-aminobutyric acid type B receptor subunit 2-like n=1 Tax=Dendronephthya gigantea TaxID=151771 RepID=UPI00106926DC|nr:gamma-aminobutyric acid type B receptor subunit 2-like [Dendronephthya gigantea]